MLLALLNMISAPLSTHMHNNLFKTTDNSFCIYLIIYSILDCATPEANKQKHCSVSVLLANMVYGQTRGPSLAQPDMAASFHGPVPTSQSFWYCLMFVLEALAALCESTDWLSTAGTLTMVGNKSYEKSKKWKDHLKNRW